MTKKEYILRLKQQLCHLGYIWEEPFYGSNVHGWRRITTRLGFKATLAEIWQKIRIFCVRFFNMDIKIKT